MDMYSTDVNVTKGSDVTGSEESHRAGQGEGAKESDRSKEKAASGAIRNMQVKKLSYARMAQNEENSSSRDNNRNSEQPGRGRHEVATS